MKKLYAFASVGVPLCVVAGLVGTRTMTVATDSAPQQRPEILPGYSLESHHIAMSEVGNTLERIGREIRQNQRISMGGITYPLSGFGGVEFNVMRTVRGDNTRTGVELHFGSDGRTTTPVRRDGQPRPEYDPYQRGGRNWTPAALADLIAEVGTTLGTTGAIVLEQHRVPFRGTASIDRRLVSSTRRGSFGYPYRLEVHVLFGEGDFVGPDDDEDYVEDQAYGLIRSLARDRRAGANRAAVAQTFATLAADLRAGRVRVGDQDLAIGDTPVTFSIAHVTATNGAFEKIEFSLEFGPRPPVTPPDEQTRYGDEQFNEPMTTLAAILQRLGAQILEDGTFEFDGQTFTAATRASWDVYASPRGFAIEVRYIEPVER